MELRGIHGAASGYDGNNQPPSPLFHWLPSRETTSISSSTSYRSAPGDHVYLGICASGDLLLCVMHHSRVFFSG